jgi:hypothetical protein
LRRTRDETQGRSSHLYPSQRKGSNFIPCNRSTAMILTSNSNHPSTRRKPVRITQTRRVCSSSRRPPNSFLHFRAPFRANFFTQYHKSLPRYNPAPSTQSCALELWPFFQPPPPPPKNPPLPVRSSGGSLMWSLDLWS